MNGEASIEMALLLAPDVVLMDVEVPGRDGISATRELRRRAPGTRSVASTAHEEAHSAVAMIAAGADSYVVRGASGPALRGAAGVLREVVRALHAEQAGNSRLDALSNGVVRSLAAAIDARDGATVVARTRAREPALRTRVVVPTGDATAATAEHLRATGADAVPTEPVEISAPIALIDEVCPSR